MNQSKHVLCVFPSDTRFYLCCIYAVLMLSLFPTDHSLKTCCIPPDTSMQEQRALCAV